MDNMNMKSIKKNWLASLSFLDNNIIYSVIVVILVLYSSTIFDNINAFVGNLFNFSLLKLLGILLIIYIAPKDTTIAILLAVAYVITIHYMVNNETFVSDKNNAPHMGSPHMGSPHMASPHMGSPHKNVEKYVDSKYKMIANTQEEHNNKMMANTQEEHHNKMMAHTQEEHHNKMMAHTQEEHHNKKMDVSREMYNNVHDKKHMKHNTKKNVEHFFPTDSSAMGSSFDIRLKNTNVDTKQANYANKNQPVKMNQSCLNTYTPQFETLGDPCVPTATFQNEFNAQGLNFPEGFNSPVVGSPL
jgi:hypothetical protein